MKEKKMNVGTQTFVALGLGLLVGLALLFMGGNDVAWISVLVQVFTLVGNIFLRCLRMLAVPLVFASVTNAVAGLGGLNTLRNLGVKTLLYFFASGCISVLLGVVVCSVIKPGTFIVPDETAVWENSTGAISVVDALSDIVPKNIVSAMANDSMMQVILFSVMIGIAILLLEDKASTIANFFKDFESVMFKVVDFILVIVPYGVFSLMVTTIISCGSSAISALIGFLVCDWITCLLVIFVLDVLMLLFIARVHPFKFMMQFKEAIMIAIASCVSVATIPFSTKTLEEKIGVPSDITKFVVPLGATANMTGTAGFFGIIVIFTAQMYGVTLTPVQIAMLIFQSVLMAIGCATVPSIALVLSSTLLIGFGLPLTAVGMVVGVYRLMDIFHTTTNAMGDWVTATCIAANDKALDESICVVRSKKQ